MPSPPGGGSGVEAASSGGGSSGFTGKWAKRGALLGIPFAAGIGSTDPLEHGLATFEEKAMGDSQFSERILGRQLGVYGALGFAGARNSYGGATLFGNASAYSGMRHNNLVPPAGSMVFGMHNSRMN